MRKQVTTKGERTSMFPVVYAQYKVQMLKVRPWTRSKVVMITLS